MSGRVFNNWDFLAMPLAATRSYYYKLFFQCTHVFWETNKMSESDVPITDKLLLTFEYGTLKQHVASNSY